MRSAFGRREFFCEFRIIFQRIPYNPEFTILHWPFATFILFHRTLLNACVVRLDRNCFLTWKVAIKREDPPCELVASCNCGQQASSAQRASHGEKALKGAKKRQSGPNMPTTHLWLRHALHSSLTNSRETNPAFYIETNAGASETKVAVSLSPGRPPICSFIDERPPPSHQSQTPVRFFREFEYLHICVVCIEFRPNYRRLIFSLAF